MAIGRWPWWWRVMDGGGVLFCIGGGVVIYILCEYSVLRDSFIYVVL